MKYVLFLVLMVKGFSGISQGFEWVKVIDAEKSYGMITDAEGNVYTTGYFLGSVDFDPGSGTAVFTAHSNTIYLQKLDAAGDFVWVKVMPGGVGSAGISLATDRLGNIYLTGSFRGTVDFDPGDGTMNIASTDTGICDDFIEKLDADGNFQWVKTISSLYDFSDRTEIHISVANDGSIILTGLFKGIVDFDPGNSVFSLVSSGFFDSFILKLDDSGNFVWARTTGGEAVIPGGMTVDSAGNVLLAGSFSGHMIFGRLGKGFTMSLSRGDEDIFAQKWSSDGDLVWSSQAGGVGADYVGSLKTDSSGNIFMTGFFHQEADFNIGGTPANLVSNGDADLFIKKFDTDGNLIWLKQIGGSGYDDAKGMMVQSSGSIFLYGQFSGEVNFNPGGVPYKVFSKTSSLFLMDMSQTGNAVWVTPMPGFYLNTFALDRHDGIFVSGSFCQTADFDPGPGVVNATAGQYCSTYVLKLDTTTVVTGLPEITRNYFSIYPNPCKSIAVLETEKTGEVKSIVLKDMAGRVVLQKEVVESRTLLDLTKLDLGLYILELFNQRDRLLTTKLIKTSY